MIILRKNRVKMGKVSFKLAHNNEQFPNQNFTAKLESIIAATSVSIPLSRFQNSRTSIWDLSVENCIILCDFIANKKPGVSRKASTENHEQKNESWTRLMI